MMSEARTDVEARKSKRPSDHIKMARVKVQHSSGNSITLLEFEL